MNETNVRNEILESIDNMNNVTLESSFDVLFSLGAAYEKSAMIMEYASNPDELNMFSIFQEADTPTQDNATAEAKPAEDNSTTVTANDNASAANAEAAKKKGIFAKIWGFIKNLFGSIGKFISNCWNGVAVPAATTVSETTKDIVDKIQGKDESWIKANWKDFIKTNLGIDIAEWFVPLGGLMIISGAVEANLLEALIGVGLAVAGVKIEAKLSTDSLKTNLKIFGLNTLIKVIIGMFGAFKAKKKISDIMKMWSDGTQDENVRPIISGDVIDVPFEEVAKVVDEVKSACTNADIKPEDVDSYVKAGENVDVTDANLTEEKKFAGFFAKISRVFIAIQNFFKNAAKTIKEFFAKLTKADEAVKEAEAKAAAPAEGTEGTGENTSNEDGTTGETGATDIPETPEDIKTPEEKSTVESAQTEVSSDDETVQESVELTEEDIEVNNHWYR